MLNCDRSPCSHSPSRALLVPWGVFAALAACSSQDKPADPSAGDRVAAQFCLNKSALPTCSNGQDGQVYFVWSDSAFYVCRSSTRTWVQTDLNGLNAAARVTPASSSSQCSSGGSTIQFGLDRLLADPALRRPLAGKRLALLAAYIEDRPFYVFDEWAAEQDPVFREIFYKDMLPRLKARGKTIIVITHDDRHYHLADRLLRLEAGKIEPLPSSWAAPASDDRQSPAGTMRKTASQTRPAAR